MRQLAIVEKEESLALLLEKKFLNSSNNVILVCNEDIEVSEQKFIEKLSLASELILYREHEQQRYFFEKMAEKPNSYLRFFVPKTPKILKKYIAKHDFRKQRKLWGYVWPQYRKDLILEGGKKYSFLRYILSVIFLPRFSSLFSYALVIRNKFPFLVRRKLGIGFSNDETALGLANRLKFYDPDVIYCDSSKFYDMVVGFSSYPVKRIKDEFRRV